MNSPPKMKWSVPNRRSKPMRKSLYRLKALSVAIWGTEIELFFAHFFLHVLTAPQIAFWSLRSQSFVEH